MATQFIEDIYKDMTTVTAVMYSSKGPHIQVTIIDRKLDTTSTGAYTPAATQELIQALEVAQKELDPSYQTREELQTQLTELLNRANGTN